MEAHHTIPFIELCNLLNVSPEWVRAAVAELHLPHFDKDANAAFTQAEYRILNLVRIMLLCNTSWAYIRDLRQKEARIREGILWRRDEFLKARQEKKVNLLGGIPYLIHFMLNEPVEITFEKVEYLDGDQKGKCDSFIELSQGYVNESGLLKDKRSFEERVEKLKEELSEFQRFLPYQFVSAKE